MSEHDSYISGAPEKFRPLLERLRGELAAALPDASEIVKYDMPGFQVGDSIVAGYAAFSRQCGLYVSPGAITALADDIAAAGLKATKTGVTFTVRQPIPDDLARELALASRRELGV
ncbi:DUF1801 domain-containing protein [Spiractinospora alimapuensis]|uniref:iron chaperone n=1 Tax=Spiractinospora alimapuensis TaxID=2820884 RepID=UPI001F46CBB5|nr:DUF1801 domain-containing protein [Spiractinospora alimapuensis]QVQ51490.1 DUF1801 domain-containing protein [Spiractinospora alimapuensis]